MPSLLSLPLPPGTCCGPVGNPRAARSVPRHPVARLPPCAVCCLSPLLLVYHLPCYMCVHFKSPLLSLAALPRQPLVATRRVEGWSDIAILQMPRWHQIYTVEGAFLRRPGVPGVDWMIGEHAGGRGGKEGRKGDSDAEANAAGVMNSGAICNFTPPASTTTTPAFIPLRPAHFAAGAESLASDNSGCRIPSCFHPVQPNN